MTDGLPPELTVRLLSRDGGPYRIGSHTDISYTVKVTEDDRYLEVGGEAVRPVRRGLPMEAVTELRQLVDAVRFPTPRPSTRQVQDAGTWELIIAHGPVVVNASASFEWPENWTEVVALHDFILGLTVR